MDCVIPKYANAPECLQLRATVASERSAAEATRAGELSSIAVVFSAFAFLALLITIFQGRSALKRAHKANAISERSAVKQLRAYVTFKEIGSDWVLFIPEGKKYLNIWLNFENSGQTPTRNLTFLAKTSENIDLHIFEEIFQPLEGCTYGLLGPGQPTRSPTLRISEDDVMRYLKGEATLFVFGGVFYDDVFKNPCETRFCFRLSFSKSTESELANAINWEAVGSHNCSDGECLERRRMNKQS